MTTSTYSPPEPVPPDPKLVSKPTKPLPRSLIESAVLHDRIPFDADKHLTYAEPPKITTMAEIGYDGRGISPVAVSEPFPLFSGEAIYQMRAEAFDKDVLENCQVASGFASNMIRAYSPKYARFAYDAWNDPKVQAIVSKIAGVDLVPTLECDIGHINVSVGLDEKPKKGEDQDSAFGWHVDSVPFVTVTMLSDCTGMVGGETAIRTGSGEVIKVRGPTMGTAVLMQGRYLEHRALKAFGGRERLAMVTSWRPKSPAVLDETVLAGVRGVTDQNVIYYQFSEYRFHNIEARFQTERLKIAERRKAGLNFDIDETRAFLEDQQRTLALLLRELVHT